MTAGARHVISIAGTRLELTSAECSQLEELVGGPHALAGRRDHELERELADRVRAALARAERAGVSSVTFAIPAHGALEHAELAVGIIADVVVGTIRAFLTPGSRLERVILSGESEAALAPFAAELAAHHRDLERESSAT